MKILPFNTLTQFLRKSAVFVVVIFLCLGMVTTGEAQSKNRIELSKPDISEYPVISTTLRAFDNDGMFIKDLVPSNLRIEENEQVVEINSLELQEPGVRFIVAINEGPTLGNRFAEVRRIDHVRDALTEWFKEQTVTSMSDFSLVTNSGIQASMLKNPADWITTLDAYQPDMKKASPGLASLSSAVDLATTATSTTQKNAAILYFTPLPTEDQMDSLNNIISRAAEANVRLFIWLAGPQTYAAADEAELLMQAAEKTDGAFFIFSGSEELPNLSSYLDPLSFIYELKYNSEIKKSGDYTLSVQVSQGQTKLESDPVSFTINVQPPNPMFLSPQISIVRSWTETKRAKDSVLQPNTATFKILIEFPDGLKRDLKYSRFFINNHLVDENTSEPFDTFEWDISQIETSDTYYISATIEDAAGFIANTVELPVDVVVDEKELTWYESLYAILNSQTILLIIIIAATGTLLVLSTIKAIKNNQKNKMRVQQKYADPVTQPVEFEDALLEPIEQKSKEEAWPHIPGVGLAPARLILQSVEFSVANLPAEIPLSGQEILIGSDPKKSKIVLNAGLVNPVHARIEKEESDHFKIYDLGSGAGTWINYAPVSTYGARLEHGDLLQFGKVCYRFEQYGVQSKKMQVLSYEDDL